MVRECHNLQLQSYRIKYYFELGKGDENLRLKPNSTDIWRFTKDIWLEAAVKDNNP